MKFALSLMALCFTSFLLGISSCAGLSVDNDADRYAELDGDCDDFNHERFPGAEERCNALDDNCNGLVDENLPIATYYEDRDGDTYGNPGMPVTSCARPDGYVANDSDCDDSSSLNKPGAQEVCDQLDNDCDGERDEGMDVLTWYRDSDQDGWGNEASTMEWCTQPEEEIYGPYIASYGDCYDGDPDINPDAVERCHNGYDDDCDGFYDEPSCAP